MQMSLFQRICKNLLLYFPFYTYLQNILQNLLKMIIKLYKVFKIYWENINDARKKILHDRYRKNKNQDDGGR